MAEITLWRPEAAVVLHQALGKLTEELGELSQIAARCLIQGYFESDPKTGEHNYVRLREEMADVHAAMAWLADIRNELETIGSPRYNKKLNGFGRWQAMLEADAAMRRQSPIGWRIANPSGMTMFWGYNEDVVRATREAHYPEFPVEPMWSHAPGDISPEDRT